MLIRLVLFCEGHKIPMQLQPVCWFLCNTFEIYKQGFQPYRVHLKLQFESILF